MFVQIGQYVLIIVFVLPIALLFLCIYLWNLKSSVDEFRQLPPEKKRREYKYCVVFCIVMWIAIVLLMLLIDTLT